MTQEEIKAECERHYEQIKKSQDRLAEIRAICKHPNTFEGNYSYRVGAIHKAEICTDCGTAIKILY